jgi:CRISPR-associated protein Cas1
LAAQYYWKALFGKGFVRNQNADGINAVLNYGYSIIRATIARFAV